MKKLLTLCLAVLLLLSFAVPAEAAASYSDKYYMVVDAQKKFTSNYITKITTSDTNYLSITSKYSNGKKIWYATAKKSTEKRSPQYVTLNITIKDPSVGTYVISTKVYIVKSKVSAWFKQLGHILDIADLVTIINS